MVSVPCLYKFHFWQAPAYRENTVPCSDKPILYWDNEKLDGERITIDAVDFAARLVDVSELSDAGFDAGIEILSGDELKSLDLIYLEYLS